MDSNKIISIVVVAMVFLVGLIIIASMFSSDKRKAEREEKAKHITKTKLVDKHESSTSQTKTSTGSAIARGVVGSAVAGPIGGLAGAATAKSNTVTNTTVEYTFKVWWDDNTETIEKCKYNDFWYKKFIEKIDI